MTRKEFYHLVYDEISRRLADCYKKDEITIEKTYLSDGEDYGLPGSTCPDFGKHDSV